MHSLSHGLHETIAPLPCYTVLENNCLQNYLQPPKKSQEVSRDLSVWL